MRKTLWFILTPILLIALTIFVIIPYIEEQKTIAHYAFKLDSSEGHVKLSDFQGKIPIIYFGYMYCPDICPTSLSVIASALAKLPKDKAENFQLIFISVDPNRDTPKALKEYAHYFYSYAIGLTGNEKYLKEITQNYGAYYAKEYDSNSTQEYTVAHTSFIYIMDKKGKLAHKLAHPQNTNDVYTALLEML
ncbi:MAG: SCO family protein [Sulfurospirillaceae bacterium]|jgi:protein SCO1/2|nr:SCO family protein [Sulfurospirillaceae bacterium]MDD2826477.1 SCO family protein [Sulfurospirillaceae bacterium]